MLNCPARLKFIKTDQFGYIECVKEYPEIFNPGKQISKTIDGGYVVVGFKSFTDQNICLVKLDNNLDTIWTRTYGPGSAQAVIQLPDSSFIISSLDGGKFFLRKTDAEGSLIWVKEILGLASLLPSYLANLNNGNFLFGKRSAIIKMNSEADTIWAKTVDGTNTSFLTHDGYILTSTLSSVKKLDLDGNQIWQKEFGSVRSFAQTSNGNYALVKGNFATPTSITISLMDTSGNILSQIPFENSGEYISSTDDGGFVVCGAIKQPYNFLYTWLLKTDSDLNYNALNIKQPLDGENLNLFNTYPIVWKANNVNYVNIDYSTDNQNT